jgi:hypothetical protein
MPQYLALWKIYLNQHLRNLNYDKQSYKLHHFSDSIYNNWLQELFVNKSCMKFQLIQVMLKHRIGGKSGYKKFKTASGLHRNP